MDALRLRSDADDSTLSFSIVLSSYLTPHLSGFVRLIFRSCPDAFSQSHFRTFKHKRSPFTNSSCSFFLSLMVVSFLRFICFSYPYKLPRVSSFWDSSVLSLIMFHSPSPCSLVIVVFLRPRLLSLSTRFSRLTTCRTNLLN